MVFAFSWMLLGSLWAQTLEEKGESGNRWKNFNSTIVEAIEARYNLDPGMVQYAGFDTLKLTIEEIVFRDFPCSLLIPGCRKVDYSNAEAVCLAFLNQNVGCFRIEPATLKLRRIHTFVLGQTSRNIQVEFTQCFGGVPIEATEVSLAFHGNSLYRLSARALRVQDENTSPQIMLDEALTILESTQRVRYQRGDSLYPVSGYGLHSRRISDDIYDFRDSLGNLIPLSDRISGSQLIFVGHTELGVRSAKLAWNIMVGIGVERNEVPYYRFLIDAITGKVIGRNPVSGGCVFSNWSPDNSCIDPAEIKISNRSVLTDDPRK